MEFIPVIAEPAVDQPLLPFNEVVGDQAFFFIDVPNLRAISIERIMNGWRGLPVGVLGIDKVKGIHLAQVVIQTVLRAGPDIAVWVLNETQCQAAA